MKTSALFLAAMAASAAVAVVPASAQDKNNANNAGMQIANNGTAQGAAACASCHGAKGEGNAAANFPRIAGQSQSYLARQLVSFANGSRNNPAMAAIAKNLTQQQIDAVSAYYAGLAPPAARAATPPPAQQKRGETLATVGDNAIGVQSCANCHGPGGSGEAPNYPYLAGQHASYLKASLASWKEGKRNTDPSHQMPQIAKRLSDADIAAVSAYFAAQPAPAPAAQRVVIPAGSAARPAAGTTSQSSGASTPIQGVGSGQGAATEGGSEGPGGGGTASGSGPSGSNTGNAR
jgi:cytochrome c553